MEYTEEKTLVLERQPPGDRWKPTDSNTIFESLTDGLEHCYQKSGCRDYHLAALDGKVFSIDKAEIKPEPPKSFSLYGE
ncbi:hypothetical protein CMI47_16880 [Candidatus Pacearchaeota archaeon]|nr:hypothetical protein [Candidatus Pacearchaeota archaeon]|tara:strand:+ start:829 stop:1065 length:237 start_codon:yes stop_codon:yes gene_type:complete